jgi:Prokaryotic RING finger family 1
MAGADPTVREATAADLSGTCGICQTAIATGEAVCACPSCVASFHHECWQEYGGCAVYGCASAPESIQEPPRADPRTVWGEEERTCPACSRTIRAAALRCRHCGATVPQRESRDRRGPGRAAALALLVAGLLPCTAPLVLVVGGPWLLVRRARVRRWPAPARVMAVVGVVAALAITAVIGVGLALRARLDGGGAP